MAKTKNLIPIDADDVQIVDGHPAIPSGRISQYLIPIEDYIIYGWELKQVGTQWYMYVIAEGEITYDTQEVSDYINPDEFIFVAPSTATDGTSIMYATVDDSSSDIYVAGFINVYNEQVNVLIFDLVPSVGSPDSKASNYGPDGVVTTSDLQFGMVRFDDTYDGGVDNRFSMATYDSVSDFFPHPSSSDSVEKITRTGT